MFDFWTLLGHCGHSKVDKIWTSSLEGIQKGNMEQEEAVKGDVGLKIEEHGADGSSALQPHLNPVLPLKGIEFSPNASGELALLAV